MSRNRFAFIPEQVICSDAYRALDATALRCFIAISLHADQSASAWPSIETIATYAGGISRRTAERAISKLVQAGLIRRSIGTGPNRTNRYTLITPRPCVTGSTPAQDDGVRETHPGAAWSLTPAQDDVLPRHAAPGKQHKNNTRTTKGSAAAPPVDFPGPLNTPQFRAAWTEYIAHRKESKLKTLTPRSVTSKLKELSNWGHDAAIESIRLTIANGWHGIFPPKGNPNDRPTRPEDRGQHPEPPLKIRQRTAGSAR